MTRVSERLEKLNFCMYVGLFRDREGTCIVCIHTIIYNCTELWFRRVVSLQFIKHSKMSYAVPYLIQNLAI